MTEQKSDDLCMGALYIRVSTHEQDELSPDAQKRLLLDYAKSNRNRFPEGCSLCGECLRT